MSDSVLIIGSGRFIRSVLVPPLATLPSLQISIYQPRGVSLCKSLSSEVLLKDANFKIDTIKFDNTTITNIIGKILLIVYVYLFD